MLSFFWMDAFVKKIKLIFSLLLIFRTLSTQPQPQDLIGFLLPTVMILIGGVSVLQALTMWIFIILVGSFFFGVIGVNVAHHHPDIFHYGDKPK